MTDIESPTPKTCVNCGQPPRALSIQVGTDANGDHLVACVPTCPKPDARPEMNGEQR